MRTISIADDFSVFPGGRIPADGPFSGQEFRERLLMPIFNNSEKVIIDFDRVRGYGSSFLEESFGGLIRRGISKRQIDSLIVFKSSKASVTEEVHRYIEAAARKAANA